MTLERPQRRTWRTVLGLAALALAWLAVGAAAAQDFPPLTGRVVDQANLLSPAVETELTAKLEALERDSSDQLVVATIADLQGREIEDYGYRLGRAWGIGQDQSDNGVLLIVAPNERKVRIEVGYGLEGVLTDALSGLIIQQRILPAFRDEDYARGIVDGVDAIDEQLRLDPEEAAARAAEAEDSGASPGPAVGVAVAAFLFMLFWIVMISAGSRRGRRRHDGVWIWAASEALRSAARGGSSWGGGGGGGGGFSGGGGSFGGGGASGGW